MAASFKQEWVELFRGIGLDEPTMKKWHVLFEQHAPDRHPSFLEWLGETETEVARIREESRGDWAS
jgi:hypothetical protein